MNEERLTFTEINTKNTRNTLITTSVHIKDNTAVKIILTRQSRWGYQATVDVKIKKSKKINGGFYAGPLPGGDPPGVPLFGSFQTIKRLQ